MNGGQLKLVSRSSINQVPSKLDVGNCFRGKKIGLYDMMYKAKRVLRKKNRPFFLIFISLCVKLFLFPPRFLTHKPNLNFGESLSDVRSGFSGRR